MVRMSPKRPNRGASSKSCVAFSALVAAGLFVATSHEDAVGPPPLSRRTAAAWKYAPWDCVDVRDRVRNRPESLEWTDPNDRSRPIAAHVRSVDAVEDAPPFSMSLCDKEYDNMRWQIMERGSYYETALTKVFVDILRHPSMTKRRDAGRDVRVVDVGSNQGWFSLVSAAMGYPVDAFDANPINSLRICESNAVNGWEGDGYKSVHSNVNSVVNVYNYGVSDQEGRETFAVPKKNPGAATFLRYEVADVNHKYVKTTMTLLTLDAFAEERGWLKPAGGDGSPDTVIAILKVDVESLEDKVFVGAKRLLRSGRVKNVLMEVTAMGPESIARGKVVTDYLAMEAKMRLHGHGLWKGPDILSGDPTGQAALDVIDKFCFQKRKTCNLWWKYAE